MAIEDYLAALFGGQTGTNDPARAGWSFPSLIGSAQAAEPQRLTPGYLSPESGAMPAPPPIPGPMEPPPASTPAAPYVPPGLQFLRMMQNHDYSMPPLPGPPPIPGPLSPPPPIPDAMPMPGGGPPQAPGSQMQPGGAKILARLYNPEPIQAPGGDDISRIVNLIGPQSGPYAAMQQTARNAQMGGQPPAAAAMQQQPTQQQPAAATPSLGARAPAAAPRTLSRADQMEASQHFQFQAPPSTKPGFYDNLLRFGLAAMAAGGKPGSNTLGALGEAGLSTFDNNQKAGQTDFENSLASRKLYYTGQDIINKRLEQAEALQVRADAIKENNATKLQLGRQAAEARQDATDMKAIIASGNQALVQQKIDETKQRDAAIEADRTDKTQDRQAKQAETAQQHAAEYYRRQRDAAEKVNPLGITPETELRITRDTATAHPNSVYAQEWGAQKATQINDARAFIQAHPAEKPKAIEKLRKIGIDPREL